MTADNEKSTLSKRQTEVLQAVAKGLSNQEIAQELNIALNTVRVHLRNIFEKIQVQSRTEAVMWAIQQGVVATDTVETDIAETDTVEREDRLVLIPPLSRWQRIYFMVAIVIAIFVLATPVVKPVMNQQNDNLVYFPKGWSPITEMPTARAYLTLVAYNGELYVIGGERTSGPTGLVEVFNPSTLTWREAAGKPTPVAKIQGVVIGDKIYVTGGCIKALESIEAVARLEIFDPVANRWNIGASLPEPLCAYAATAYADELYLIGGWNGEAYVNTVYIYNPRQDTWRLMEQPYPFAVGYAAAATIGDKIYVVGGYDDQKEYPTVNSLNPKTQKWTGEVALKQPRGGLGLTVVDENLYAIGGGWKTPLVHNEQLKANEAEWQELSSPYPRQWRNFGMTTLGADLFMAGGWNGDYLNLIIAYKTPHYTIFLPVVQ